MNPFTSSAALNQVRGNRFADAYAMVRTTTEELAAPLSAEDQMIQPMTDASPTKWHQAHTTWFFETFILAPHFPGYRHFDPNFTFLFNSYYKQLQGHPNRSSRGLMSRPSLEQVRAYRRYVDEHMLRLLGEAVNEQLAPLVELGLNHEQQHQELIVTDIKYALAASPLQPGYIGAVQTLKAASAPLHWLAWDEGVYEIGHAGGHFAYDNESPRHRVYLQAFELASRLVNNREYLKFMDDGGYRHPELWLSDGWDQVCAHSWNAPLYWDKGDDGWSTFTCSGIREINLDEPVCHLSYYEADAFARWAGARLASEAEWEIVASTQPVEGNFLEDRRFHPRAAAYDGANIQQLFGDAWEWTSSPYIGYPGYRAVKGAVGEYNGKFMCNQMVLRGGSCVTPRSHIRATYRNFFPPHIRWQFAGIRLAK
jgi:ergothioneine biosynthesis protein EgtB